MKGIDAVPGLTRAVPMTHESARLESIEIGYESSKRCEVQQAVIELITTWASCHMSVVFTSPQKINLFSPCKVHWVVARLKSATVTLIMPQFFSHWELSHQTTSRIEAVELHTYILLTQYSKPQISNFDQCLFLGHIFGLQRFRASLCSLL